MSVPSVVLNVQQGIEAQKRLKEVDRDLKALYIEYGYRAALQGMSLADALVTCGERKKS